MVKEHEIVNVWSQLHRQLAVSKQRSTCVLNQGIIDCKGTETRQITKKFKELFASTLNGITASVRCVSFIIVVLNAKLTRLIAAHANTKA